MDDIAEAVLVALGGRDNVSANTVCMTRLRVTLRDPHQVDFQALNAITGVLGTATRGYNGLEVVFGPRVIDGVYHAFLRLTGLEAGMDALFPMSRQETNFKVQINVASRRDAKAPVAAKKPAQSKADKPKTSPVPSSPPRNATRLDDDDLNALKELFAELDEDEGTRAVPAKKGETRLLVLNGPNVNMIGVSNGHVSAGDEYSKILELCQRTAREVGFSTCVCLQSNHEGDLVDWVQDAWESFDAIVINATSYGATSLALPEAIRSVGIPTAQVSINDASAKDTPLGLVCATNVAGEGIVGYARAIRELARRM